MSSPENGARADNKAITSDSVEADIAILSSLLSQDGDVDESNPDVAELLRKLEAAEGLAGGVETRLDGIINSLDGLLDDLEANHSSTSAQRNEEERKIVNSNEGGATGQ